MGRDQAWQFLFPQFMIPKSIIPFRRLHESTRRQGCRLALIGLGFLPLSLLLFFSAVSSMSWYRDWEKHAWEQRVSRTLGIDVSAKDFRWTAPYQFHADQVEIRDPETHAILGCVGGIDGMMKTQGWSVILDAPAIDGEQLDRGIDVLHDWFLCRPQTSSQLLAMAIPNGMTIHHGLHKTALHRIDIVFRPSERVSAIQAKWQLEGQPFGEVSLHISREHSSEDSTTRMELSSPSTWLPCSIAEDRFPFLQWMGQGAKFRGVVQYRESRRTWDAMLAGEVQDLDLGGMTSSIGSALQGTGALVLKDLHVRDGRILKATGDFRSQAGRANRKWLQRVAEILKMPALWEADSGDAVPIDQTGFEFALDPSGIRLVGTLPSPNDWPPIAARLGSSSLCANGALVPVSQMVQALQRDEGNGAWLAQILPLPESNSIERRESATSSLRFRLSRNAGRNTPQ